MALNLKSQEKIMTLAGSMTSLTVMAENGTSLTPPNGRTRKYLVKTQSIPA